MVKVQEIGEDYEVTSDYDVTSLNEGPDDLIEVVEGELNGDNCSFNETFLQRLSALQYMVPYAWRKRFDASFWRCFRFCKRAMRFGGNAVWVLTTSLLLVGLPLFLAYDREQALLAYEKEGQLTQFAGKLASGSA